MLTITPWQWLNSALQPVLGVLSYVNTLRPQDLDIEDLFNYLSQAPSDDHGARIEKVYEWRFERYKLFVQAAFAALLGVIGLLFASYMTGDFSKNSSPLSDGPLWRTVLIVLANLAVPIVPFLFCYWRMRLSDRLLLVSLTHLLPMLEEPPEDSAAESEERITELANRLQLLTNSVLRLGDRLQQFWRFVR